MNKKHSFIIFLCLICHINIGYSQSTRGDNFWFGYLSNFYGPGGSPLYVYISAENNVSGTISVPGISFNQTFTVAANTTLQITMPIVEPPYSEGAFDLAVHIQTCDKVTVYAQNAGAYTNDATVILPASTLGDRYMVLNINGWPLDLGDEVLIVASQNNSQIRIIPSVNTDGGQPAGVPFIITLNAGQTYQITNTATGQNLSGTIIENVSAGQCSPFAVFSGNRCLNIGGCTACDHLYEQLLPLSALGKEYVLPPLMNKSTTWYRILAPQNGTVLSINGGAPISLNAGQVHQFNNDIASYVSANNSIMIMQYAQGFSCDLVGDPFQILMYPVEQSINNITCNAFQSNVINQYWVNITLKTASLPNVLLDGNNVSAAFSPVPSNPTYSFARINIAQGNHTLVCPAGLLAYIYGWGSAESFGYCAGASIIDFTDDFTASPTLTCPGSVMNFAAMPDPNTSAFIWDFGDSIAATGQNVSHTYSSAGTFTVTLTKQNNVGCNKIIKKDVIIMNTPIHIVENDITICSGQSVSIHLANIDSVPIYTINGCGDSVLSFVSIQYDSIVWITGDTGSTISITPQSSMTVYVYGYNDNCMGIDSIKIAIAELSAGFSFQNQCLGTPVCFSDTSYISPPNQIQSYLWNFGDSSPTGNNQNPCHTYINPGTYTATLTITGTGGCSDVQSHTVNIFDFPQASFTVNNSCANQPAVFINTSQNPAIGTIAAQFWDFGNGTSTQQNPPPHAYQAGTYQVTLITYSSNLGCSDTATATIDVYPLPVPNFLAMDVCLNQSMNFYDSSLVPGGTISGWTWNFDDNTSLNTSSGPAHMYTNPGMYGVSLIATTNNGCKDTIVKNVVVHPPPNTQFSAANVCDGDSAQFLDLSNISLPDVIQFWTWNFGDASPADNNQNTSHPYTTVGSYLVQLLTISDFGCKDSITKTLVVRPNPVVAFAADKTVGCSPLCLSFTDMSSTTPGSSIVYWSWNLGDNSAVSHSQNFEHCYTNASADSSAYFTVALTVTSDSGCVSTGTKSSYITVYPNPKAGFVVQPQTTVVTEPLISITNLSQGGNFWNWNFGDQSTSAVFSPQSHTYADTGIYSIILIISTQYGCADTAYQTVIIEPDFAFFIPNAFSPNGDSINDTFNGKGIFIKKYQMMIYDRWGNLIFFTDSINKPWDGKANHGDEMAQRDVYVYVVEVTDFKRKKHNYRGIVTLVR